MRNDHGFVPGAIDFDALYQGEPPSEGAEFGFEVAPWDIGGPQPAVVALREAGQIRDEVLDAGCGLGGNSLYLAETGHRVTGFDGARSAVARSREQARRRGLAVEFVHANATSLDGIEQRFATVLDSALYHCLDAGARSEYAAALHRVTVPGARLHLLCFADTDSPGLGMPIAVSRQDLREHLGGHWRIEGIELVDYTTSFTREFLASLTNEDFATLGVTVDLPALRTDDRDRATVPMWQLRAARDDG